MKYNLQTGSHTVYALQYHFVTVTKYRATILTEEIAERIGEIANELSDDFGVGIQNVNGGSDHIHILFTAKPTTDMTKFINSLKGVTSRKVRSEYPEVKQTLEDSFWQPGYFLASTGQVSIDVLMDYVEDQ
ncbi:IS200/IS605 family transposase [Natronolimnobius sp. AArcel1]|uniref:IS200/IS605 family transposase n=1 Tax=Natronolimnobius sp. AArcel1 TaxID=1679093 RepID=UPI0013E9E935|nr:IS200/IS605 family transposase [Natronolimnobius sp. AArcel1]NGM70019.1 IS200/IS605 family transposase [Natronolimnobius sp. AArcel1]